MDSELKNILEDLHIAVELSIQLSKKTNDIGFIDVSIEELNKIIVLMKNDKNHNISDFLMAVQGLIDELNVLKDELRRTKCIEK